MSDVVLTREQVRRLDGLAIEELGIPGVVLMENAGRGAAEQVRGLLGDGRRVRIVCGGGNNGGDGFVIARHLHNAGVEVACWLLGSADDLGGDAATNHAICRAMGLTVERYDPSRQAALLAALKGCDVVVDAILGTGFRGEVRSPADRAIAAINASGRPVLAVDVPSGLDCDTGRPAEPCVQATVTVTFAAAKVGLLAAAARESVGRLVVASIGTPPELAERVATTKGTNEGK